MATGADHLAPQADSSSFHLGGRNGMSFGIYLTGFVVVIAGLIYGASLMHVPTHWVVAGGVLVRIGILTGVKATPQKDSAT
jgi:hypothetical protein